MADDPLANLECKVGAQQPATDEEGGDRAKAPVEQTSTEGGEGKQKPGEAPEKGEAEHEGGTGPRVQQKRRRSRALGPAEAGCYLSFDDDQKKWVGVWSATVLDDVVAFLRPKTKVPQFKYTKKEKVVFKSEAAAAALRDEKKDFLRGLCLFIKLAKEFKGEFLLISKADLDDHKVRLFGLTDQKEVMALDLEDVFYDASKLKAAAVVPSSPTSVYKAKTMELPTFIAEAEREGGTAVSFEK